MSFATRFADTLGYFAAPLVLLLVAHYSILIALDLDPAYLGLLLLW